MQIGGPGFLFHIHMFRLTRVIGCRRILCGLDRFFRHGRLSPQEFIDEIRRHIYDLGDGILILYVDKLCHASLNYQNGAGTHLGAHASAAPVFLLDTLCKASGRHTTCHINQRDDDCISHLYRFPHHGLVLTNWSMPLNNVSIVDVN